MILLVIIPGRHGHGSGGIRLFRMADALSSPAAKLDRFSRMRDPYIRNRKMADTIGE
jgi:hypothetical protein